MLFRSPLFPSTGWIERSYAPNLPPFIGGSDTVLQLLRTLLTYAQRHLATIGRRHGLRISTSATDQVGGLTALDTALHTPGPSAEIEVRLQETDTAVAEHDSAQPSPGDVFEAYALVKQLGGRLELLAPAEGLLSITVWIPLRSAPPLNWNPELSSPPAEPAHTPDETSSLTEAADLTSPPTPQPLPLQTPPPLPDRRASSRIAARLPAHVTIGNVVREGTLTDLNSRGAAVEIAGRLPALDPQPASLVLKTAAGVFELQATAHGRGMAPQLMGGTMPASQLIFLFGALTDTEQRILESYIEEARARTLSATVEAHLMESDRSEQPDSITVEPQLRGDRKSTRLNSSHIPLSRMPSSA